MTKIDEQLKKVLEREELLKASQKAEAEKLKEKQREEAKKLKARKLKLERAQRKAEEKEKLAEERAKSSAVFKAVKDFYKKGAWGDLEKFKATITGILSK